MLTCLAYEQLCCLLCMQRVLMYLSICAVCVQYRDPTVIDAGLLKFTAYIQAALASLPASDALLVPDLRSSVYHVGVHHGGVAAYQQLRELMVRAELAEEKVRCLCALGNAQHADQIGETLELALSSHVRSQDAPSLFSALFHNPAASQQTWHYVRDNWDKQIVPQFGGGSGLQRIVTGLGAFASDAMHAELSAFFATHEAPGAERALKQALERVQSNAAWWKRDAEDITHWLRTHSRHAEAASL